MVYGFGGRVRRHRRLGCGCIGVCDGSCGTSLVEQVIGTELEIEGIRDDDPLEVAEGAMIADGGFGGSLLGLAVAEEFADDRGGYDDGGQDGYPDVSGGDW